MSVAHSSLVNRILLAAPRDRCRLWANPTGFGWVGKRMMRFGVDGQADISGILADGRRIEIEVKVKTGLHEAQRRFGAMIKSFGGI